jgi:hypothetical protein
MKEAVTNDYEDQEQSLLTAACWRKGWANWGASDPDLADMSAKVMMHSKATRAQHYLESAEGDLAAMGPRILGRIMGGSEEESGDSRPEEEVPQEQRARKQRKHSPTASEDESSDSLPEEELRGGKKTSSRPEDIKDETASRERI